MLAALIAPFARGARQAPGVRPPFPSDHAAHCLQLGWNLSDPALEEGLHERPLCFGTLRAWPVQRACPMSLLEKHQLEPQALAVFNAGLAH